MVKSPQRTVLVPDVFSHPHPPHHHSPCPRHPPRPWCPSQHPWFVDLSLHLAIMLTHLTLDTLLTLTHLARDFLLTRGVLGQHLGFVGLPHPLTHSPTHLAPGTLLARGVLGQHLWFVDLTHSPCPRLPPRPCCPGSAPLVCRPHPAVRSRRGLLWPVPPPRLSSQTSCTTSLKQKAHSSFP